MKCELIDIINVKVLDRYNLYLEFEDGAKGKVDISKLLPFKGVFKQLDDQEFFNTVSVNPDIGTICWKNGADLSPTYLRKNMQTN